MHMILKLFSKQRSEHVMSQTREFNKLFVNPNYWKNWSELQITLLAHSPTRDIRRQWFNRIIPL